MDKKAKKPIKFKVVKPKKIIHYDGTDLTEAIKAEDLVKRLHKEMQSKHKITVDQFEANEEKFKKFKTKKALADQYEKIVGRKPNPKDTLANMRMFIAGALREKSNEWKSYINASKKWREARVAQNKLYGIK